MTAFPAGRVIGALCAAAVAVAALKVIRYREYWAGWKAGRSSLNHPTAATGGRYAPVVALPKQHRRRP